MKFNTAEEAIEYLHKVTKQQEIRDETNKLMDRCYAKGSHGLMVFQRQKFLNELLPLLDRLGVVKRVDREGNCEGCKHPLSPGGNHCCVTGCRCNVCNKYDDLAKAGYVATESLIEEG